MSREITKLPITQFSGLDYDNIVTDIENLIRQDPEYNQIWEDFLEANGGRTLIELFAWITDQLASRVDLIANENFISTARDKDSIVKLLKLLGYNFKLPYSAEASVKITYNKQIQRKTYSLSSFNANSNSMNLLTLQVKNKNGRTVNYEAIPYSKDKEEFQYIDNNVYVTPSSDGRDYIKMYEGRTYVRNFTTENSDNQKFTLPENNIAQNSIRVYLIEENQNGQVNYEECLLVRTFLEKNAQTSFYIDGSAIPLPYIINVLENNRVEIEFAPQSLIYPQDRRPQVNDVFKIFYRTTSGKEGEIASKAINTQKNLVLRFLDGTTESSRLNLINENSSSGGKDGETKESAISKAPLEIRTVRKTVTEEDYEIILNQNEDIMKVKSYSWSNAPSNIYSVYNEYMGPHEVWNYIIPYKQGWENLKTFEYNDFNWFNFRLQNYFNEPANFINGSSNKLIEKNKLNIFYTDKTIDDTVNNLDPALYGTNSITFSNYVILPFNDYSELLGNEASFRLKVTENINDKSYFNEINNIITDDSTNNDVIKIENDSIRLRKDINAFLFSNRSIGDTGVSFIINSKTVVKLSIDSEDKFFIHNFVDNKDLNTLNTNKVNIDIEDIKNELNTEIDNFSHLKKERVGFNFVNFKTNKQKRDFETIEIISSNISAANFRIQLIDDSLNSQTYQFSISLDGSTTPKTMTDLLTELQSQIDPVLKNVKVDWHTNIDGFINDIYFYTTNHDSINIIDGDADGNNRFFVNLNSSIELSSSGQALSSVGGLVDSDNTLNSKTEFNRNEYYTYETKTPEFYFGFGDNSNIDGGNGNNTRIVSESEFRALNFRNVNTLFNFRIQITDIENQSITYPNDGTIDYSIDVSSITTIEQLVNNLNTVLTGGGGLGGIAEFIIDGSKNEIVLRMVDLETTKNYQAISIIPPTTGNYLLGSGEINSNIVDSTTMDTAIAFSSYNEDGYLTYKNAFEWYEANDNKFLKVTSPKIGTDSLVVFSVFGGDNEDVTRDVSDILFGINFPINGDMQKNYGYQALTMMYEIIDGDANTFQESLIWENGSYHFDRSEIDDFYLQYILSEKNSYKIGSYFAENFNESDARYKELPKALFPTYYIKDSQGEETDVVNLLLSDYVLAFSSDPVSASSVYSILNSGDKLSSISKVENPALVTRVLGENDTDGITGFDQGISYAMILRIDEFTENISIEFTGGTNDTRIDVLKNDINTSIRTFFINKTDSEFGDVDLSFFNDDIQRAKTVYTSYEYATIVSEINSSGVVEKRIRIESPTFFNYSKVEITDPSTSSALSVLFDGEPVWTTNGEQIIDSQDSIGYTAIPKGDYYISYDQVEEAMYLNKSLVTNVPDNLFYIHYIYDRRDQDILLDEDIYRNYLSQFKIVGIDNKFKPTKFSTFDVKGTVYYNKVFTEEYVREKVEEKLYDEYNLLRVEHGNTISKSKFLSYIHESEKNAISSVEITYFGKDASDPNTNELNFIQADFDEIIVLSDELFENGVKTKGLMLEYRGVS